MHSEADEVASEASFFQIWNTMESVIIYSILSDNTDTPGLARQPLRITRCVHGEIKIIAL